MKSNLWKLAMAVFILTMLILGLAMLLAGCGPEEEEEVIPTPLPVKPTATPVPAAPPTDTPVPGAAEGPVQPTATPVSAVLPTDTPVPPPAETEGVGGLIDDFEGGDFDDRWWSYTDEGTVSFACTPDQPGHDSTQAMRLTFEVGEGSYANCGIDVDPGRWEDAGGLSFFWRADQAGLTVILTLDMEDPTQTHPEAEGLTPFQAELQTSGEEWTPVMLTWDAFAKAEWVGEGGVDVLDPTHVVGLYFEVIGEQSGSAWFDDLQLTGLEVAMPMPTLPPTDTPVPSPAPSEAEGEVERKTEEPVPPTAPPPQAGPVMDKWALWTGGTHLRGANIWQAIVIPELDGLEFKGPGPVGPPYAQEDFDRLAAMGANYVSISGPGLFTETPPYTVDPGIQAYLDNLLAMIAEADLFATIGFRSGPGRSEFSLCCGGDPYYEGYFNDSVWEDQAAQDGWVEMWRYTAERYRDNPIVAGYKLMVEPNAAGILLDIYDPEEFYPDYTGTLYDWNQLYPRIVAAIREVDPNTPILVGGMGWSGVAWLPYLQPTDDPRTVYVVHQYAPQDLYTHQEPDGENTYPGVFDTDWDGQDDQFDRAWLDGLLSVVDEFAATHGVPVAVDEYGLQRWVPSGAAFMEDQMDLFEQRGMNYALWEWQTSWELFAEEVHAFNFLLGPDPNNRAVVATSDLMDVIVKYWERNTVRPSNLAEEPTTPTSSPAGSDWWKPALGHRQRLRGLARREMAGHPPD